MTEPKENSPLPRLVVSASVLLVTGIAVLTGGHLIAAVFPGVDFWGIDYWSAFPPGVRIVSAAFVAVALVGWLRARPGRLTVTLPAQWWVRGVLLVAAGVVFYLLRSRALAYGDGYTCAGYFADGQFPELSGNWRTHPLDLIVHWFVQQVAVAPLGGTAEHTYALLSAVAGVVSLGAIIRIAGILSNGETRVRSLIIAAGLSSAGVALWFGYVEVYALSAAAGLWSLAFAVGSTRNRRMIVPAWLLWLLACGFHLVAVPLVPAIAWATWRALRPGRARFTPRVSASLFLAGLIGCGLATFVFSLVVDFPVFVPLIPSPDSSYAAFSLSHITDAVNLILFLAPVGILGVIVWLSGLYSRRWRSTPGVDADEEPGDARGVLGVAAAGFWYFAFWVDPLLGAFRDWDLLSAFGIPLSLWGGAVLAAGLRHSPRIRLVWLPVAVFALVHAGLFVVALQDETAAVLRVNSLIRQDPHYSATFYQGDRLRAWISTLTLALNRYDLAKEHLHLRLSLVPDDPKAWATLGTAYHLSRHYDSAAVCYAQVLRCDPTDAMAAHNLGIMRYLTDDLGGARHALEHAASLSATAYETRLMLGQTYRRLGMFAEADSTLLEAAAIQPRYASAYYLLAECAEERADTNAAIGHYEAILGVDTLTTEAFQRLAELYRATGQDRKAADLLRERNRRRPPPR